MKNGCELQKMQIMETAGDHSFIFEIVGFHFVLVRTRFKKNIIELEAREELIYNSDLTIDATQQNKCSSA